MLRHVRVSKSLMLGLALSLAFAGCSNMPTQPAAQAESDAGTGSAPAQVFGLPGGGAPGVTTKTTVVGILGGVVAVGDFVVVIPPTALTRTSTITVQQLDLLHPIVHLTISPASANGFRLPVLLVANANRMDRKLLSAACISYYNPATGNWDDLSGSAVSVAGLTVTAPLWHFSTYRVSSGGKAGW